MELVDNRGVIEIDPEKMSGTPVFRGTRVPIQNLFDYVDEGDELDVFLDDFPMVTHEQAVGILRLRETQRTKKIG